MYQDKEIAVIGSGSWGTALAILVAENFGRVKLWGRNTDLVNQIASERCNRRYLPDVMLPDNVSPTTDFDAAIANSTGVLVVSPGYCFREILTRLQQTIHTQENPPSALLWGTKSLGPSGVLLSNIAKELFADSITLGVVSGPSFAAELAKKMPTALTVATTNKHTDEISSWFHSATTRIYRSEDLIGVQLGGAIKNVFAIAAGISDGLGYGANARTALIARGLSEMTRLGVAMGGNKETLMGLSGLGDLVLTCTDNQSRNRQLGIGIGQGTSVEEILRQIGQAVEGLETTKLLFELAKKHQIDMPIAEQVYRILYLQQDPKESVKSLLQRQSNTE